jgi:chemotaxis signal transduction protein
VTPDRDKVVMAEVFRRRARQLAERRTVSRRADTHPVLVFRLDRERYAIEVSELLEVLPYRGCTAVPGAPAAVLGVLNVRGDIRPVVDLRRLLGVTAAESASLRYLLMLRHESGAIGLAVDALETVRQVEAGELVSGGARTAELAGSRNVKALTADTVIVIDTRAALSQLGAH